MKFKIEAFNMAVRSRNWAACQENDTDSYETIWETRYYILDPYGMALASTFRSKEDAQRWLKQNCTVRGIKAKYARERREVLAEIKERQNFLKKLKREEAEELKRLKRLKEFHR